MKHRTKKIAIGILVILALLVVLWIGAYAQGGPPADVPRNPPGTETLYGLWNEEQQTWYQYHGIVFVTASQVYALVQEYYVSQHYPGYYVRSMDEWISTR